MSGWCCYFVFKVLNGACGFFMKSPFGEMIINIVKYVIVGLEFGIFVNIICKDSPVI